jgi:hypothetical protein
MPEVPHDQPHATAAAASAQSSAQPSDEEMRAAYEAELNRITSTDMILQTAVSLLNIGGRRLGLARPSDSGAGVLSDDPAAGERDLEQVRDAIDAVRALMPVLERRMPPRELGPLRDAVSQLQMAYAREVQSAREPAPAAAAAQASPGEPDTPTRKPASRAEGEKPAPGPAESSGRLWVPGR